MRWKVPECGTKKVVRKFLWLPRILRGYWRWLEYAEIEYEYFALSWHSIRWADLEEEDEC